MRKMVYYKFLVAAAIFGATSFAMSHVDENTPLSIKETRQQFQQDRFGLFIHWGIYSVLGDGEWVMNDKKIPAKDYERIARAFNPADFDAKAWVDLARSAGMKYITFTSKHHDGFAMWDSKVSDYNVVKRTPFGRDVVKELADECHRQGVKLFLYHSHLDWHHPDFFPLGDTGHFSGRPESGDWNKYLDYMDAQLKELLTNYGKIDGVWFDGWWDKPNADWRLERTYKMIHDLQPACLVGNNHHRKPMAGEDFQMFERDLPGQNTAGYSGTSELGYLPPETCDTINTSWGYRITDHNYKSARQLLEYLVRAAGMDANLLLNVGPMPSGEIQPEFRDRLHEIGLWLAKNGESIYGTRRGPTPPQPWGATTRRDNKVYVHVLDKDTSSVQLHVSHRVRAARYFDDESEVPFTDEGGTVTLQLRPERPRELDRLVLILTD
jgi:alpha-L-fucosidase